MRIAVVCLIAFTVWPVWAQAAEQNDAAEPDIDCKTASATPAVEICASRDYHAADLRLNEAYRAAAASTDKGDLPPDVRAKWHGAFVEAQRRWIAFRDAECALTGYEWYRGTGRSVAEIACMTELTNSRIDALKRHANPN